MWYIISNMSVDISKFSTMKVGGSVTDIRKIKDKASLLQSIESSARLRVPFFVLGEGSNTIFRDIEHSLIVLKMENAGISIEKSDRKNTLVRVGAGERWDNFVKWSVENNFSGIEALSGIPGTVGASPIQNIGAYGSEVKNTIVLIEAYDTTTKKFVNIPRERCGFEYRNSVFKKNPGRFIPPPSRVPRGKVGGFIIWSVYFNLCRNSVPVIPKYKDIIEYFEEKNISAPNLNQIRETVLEIRARKLPDPSVIPSCGSFFKNPILTNEAADNLKFKYPEMPVFPVSRDRSKISAGWLIEKAGLKGYAENNIGVYEHNALVLINRGGGSFEDLDNLRNRIKEKILSAFGIMLEEEVNIV